jgi:hypothetical protein
VDGDAEQTRPDAPGGRHRQTAGREVDAVRPAGQGDVHAVVDQQRQAGTRPPHGHGRRQQVGGRRRLVAHLHCVDAAPPRGGHGLQRGRVGPALVGDQVDHVAA